MGIAAAGWKWRRNAWVLLRRWRTCAGPQEHPSRQGWSHSKQAWWGRSQRPAASPAHDLVARQAQVVVAYDVRNGDGAERVKDGKDLFQVLFIRFLGCRGGKVIV